MIFCHYSSPCMANTSPIIKRFLGFIHRVLITPPPHLTSLQVQRLYLKCDAKGTVDFWTRCQMGRVTYSSSSHQHVHATARPSPRPPCRPRPGDTRKIPSASYSAAGCIVRKINDSWLEQEGDSWPPWRLVESTCALLRDCERDVPWQKGRIIVKKQ